MAEIDKITLKQIEAEMQKGYSQNQAIARIVLKTEEKKGK